MELENSSIPVHLIPGSSTGTIMGGTSGGIVELENVSLPVSYQKAKPLKQLFLKEIHPQFVKYSFLWSK